jgi:2'-5' RNA ligase
MTTRTFIALDLSHTARETLRRELRRVERTLPGVRLTDPADLHLTLAFLGEQDDDALATIIALTADVARQGAPFMLALRGFGVFGPPHAPSVLWMGVGGETRRLIALQRRLADALEAQGFPREQRPYAPHLTLARLKRPLDEGAFQRLSALLAGPKPPATRWRVDDIRVMRSERTAVESRYTALSIAPLAGETTAQRSADDRMS